ncbi:hypothetical protein BC833DRAFT_621209 [Globomyces pollinis-pini]|nr:hypothetical protein BC833DRAFT_621209 [Globomyces pollinis-pini]
MDEDEKDEDQKDEGPIIGVYVGERNDQKERHGNGKNNFPNGDVYEGSYSNGKRKGLGTYKWKAGHRYKGDYQDNLRHGQGYFNYPDGSKYNGSFANGKRHGQGVYVYVNGDVYQGDWEEDVKHGIGIYHYATGGKKKGVWVNGSLKGEGSVIHADHVISGVFINDDEMEMPVKLSFPSSGYSKMVTDPKLVAMVPAVVAE